MVRPVRDHVTRMKEQSFWIQTELCSERSACKFIGLIFFIHKMGLTMSPKSCAHGCLAQSLANRGWHDRWVLQNCSLNSPRGWGANLSCSQRFMYNYVIRYCTSKKSPVGKLATEVLLTHDCNSPLKRSVSFASPVLCRQNKVSFTTALLAPMTVPSPLWGLINICGINEFPFISISCSTSEFSTHFYC